MPSKPPPPGRAATHSSNADKHPSRVNISGSDEDAVPAQKTQKTQKVTKPRVTKAPKSVKEVEASIEHLTTHEEMSLKNDMEAVTPCQLFTPASVHLDKYKSAWLMSSEPTDMLEGAREDTNNKKKMGSTVNISMQQKARDPCDRQEMEVAEGTTTKSDSNEELAPPLPSKAVKKWGTSTKEMGAEADGLASSKVMVKAKAKGKAKALPPPDVDMPMAPLIKARPQPKPLFKAPVDVEDSSTESDGDATAIAAPILDIYYVFLY